MLGFCYAHDDENDYIISWNFVHVNSIFIDKLVSEYYMSISQVPCACNLLNYCNTANLAHWSNFIYELLWLRKILWWFFGKALIYFTTICFILTTSREIKDLKRLNYTKPKLILRTGLWKCIALKEYSFEGLPPWLSNKRLLFKMQALLFS